MDKSTLQIRLRSILIGIMVAVCFIVSTLVMLPNQGQCESTNDYGYVYSGAKSSSVDFVHANLSDDTLLVLGSSEFSTPERIVPQVPAATFGKHNYGVHFMLVGEAFDQCLWDTIALGAFANGGLPNNKVALIVGLGMFSDGGVDSNTFQTRFSHSLYRAFCKNALIPQELKQKVQRRLVDQGLEEISVRTGTPQNLLDAIDATVLDCMDDLKLRQQLRKVRESGIIRVTSAAEQPDWISLREQAYQDAKRMSTTNDWGVEDEFYTEQLEPNLEVLKDTRVNETYSDTPEYDDLELFLQTCDACGIEPLVIIEPTLGYYYDHIGITKQTRDAAYQRIRDIAASHHNARLVDFSDREYEQYFLFDIVHFGWTGWIEAEKALFEFATEEI